MKIISVIMQLMLFCLSIQAIPADGLGRFVSQLGGDSLLIKQVGDEHLHFFETDDDYIVIQAEDMGWYYAELIEGKLMPTNILAHNFVGRGLTETIYLKNRFASRTDNLMRKVLGNQHVQLIEQCNLRRSKTRRETIGVPTHYIGRKKGLVILVNFPNLEFSTTTANSDYQQMFNQTGYMLNGHLGSVHDYFFDQSYGQFDLTFDVVGPVTVSRNYGYYGSDALSGYNDRNVGEMITEACQLADEYVDYRDYDWDADGSVDQVFIVYAGYGQATGGPANTIWPHESHLMNSLLLDETKISQYACSNELYGSSGSAKTLMGIGVACHEFSHCLGLPDLYDTDYSGAYGMSYWDVMNSGSYNGPKGIGEVPCGYSAYERWFAGWLNFTNITESQKIDSLPSLEASPTAYRVLNEGNENEFYTFENRQPEKWFKYVGQYQGAHGLLVTHIDYDFKAWSSNRVNPNTKHQRMSPVVADNSYGQSYSDIVGDLFPGNKNVTMLNNISHTEYGGRLYNKNWDNTYNMNKTILEIQEDDGGLISFDVIFNYELPTPIALMATDITENSFKASWNGEMAESYTLELDVIKSVKPFVSEKSMIENIQETEYHVNDIDAVYCTYRVRANKENLHTEWSNSINVTLENSNGINDLHVSTPHRGDTSYQLNGLPVYKHNKGNVFIHKNNKYIYR